MSDVSKAVNQIVNDGLENIYSDLYDWAIRGNVDQHEIAAALVQWDMHDEWYDNWLDQEEED